MSPITSVEVHAGPVVVARASLGPDGVPRIDRVDGTDDDVRFIRCEAFGADNVFPLDPHKFFSQLLSGFPPGLATAFWAHVAIPSYGP